ncbi:ASCH domain-containing protein [Serratia marcescens]|uniref:hypothetical protein n=1 Tax=Serratia marcescens TaxID=615 RepID=UPI000744F246|nr:hypothetical protein [Serratia marcescens]CUY61250.1 Uncharacterised protein [Serratia marcescens]CUY67351.1 Uncharacterised protein [Serratia marcescens]CVA69340.1 Uncharacterised protein [Serratia marcescens]CVA72281.1 Uncharacterised protein [Serratia marcescens]CVE07210.1 Uncharacterised protein [Serratia marcescens]
MKERPVIFNGEMVRAILDGRKTQTRRVIKVQPESKTFGLRKIIESENASEEGKYYWSLSDALGISRARSNPFLCPFGQVGDRLWVRETWADVNHDGHPAIAYRADGGLRVIGEDDGEEEDPNLEKYWFAQWYADLISGAEGNWRPSIHMPRWASRITLEITAVRVERLNDISEEDAKAEGVKAGVSPGHEHMMHQVAFSELWQSIYGEESWGANPWVWVIEFKQVGAREVERG